MKIGERLFWRVLAADILLAGLWLILGGSLLEAIIIAMLQAGLLLMVEGVIRGAHQLKEDAEERRIEKWARRRSR